MGIRRADRDVGHAPARAGRAFVPLVATLALAWSAPVWAAGESPWWAPVLVGLFNLAILLVGHWNDRKRRRLARRLSKVEKQRDDYVGYLIAKGVIPRPPPESGFVIPGEEPPS